ncbi:alpha-ketoacid dehydrogenase subunit beta [Spirillospora sp. CA-255316]
MTETATAGDTAKMSMAAAFNSSLDLALQRDRKVILLGEDIADPVGGSFKVTKGLSTKYGEERVRNTPISEQAIVGAAVGAAMAGYRPVAEILLMDFIAVAMDQLVNHAAKLRYMSGGATNVPLTVRTPVGQQRFGAQHTQSLEAWFMHTPGIKVVMPSTANDAKGLLTACIDDDDPCLVIENVSMLFTQKDEVPLGEHTVPLGLADVKRVGSDVSIITYGAAVHTALSAADDLAAAGVSAEVVDLRSLVPLDMETVLRSVSKTRRAVVLHDATTFCGPGAEVSSQIHESLFGDLLAPVKRIGAPYTPAPFGASGLEFLPTSDRVVGAVKELVSQ